MSKAFKCLLCGRIITGGPNHAKCYIRQCPLTTIDQSNLVPMPEHAFVRIPNSEGNLGKYDDDAEELLRKHSARTVLLMVIGGDKGQGFSMSTVDHRMLNLIPGILRYVADDIEQQAKDRRNKK